jgi:serine/threonine protein kinase
MIGTVLGRYRIVALLGEGGMGKVWKAEDTILGRPVALKFLPGDATSDDSARFLRGLRAAAALNHPGIAQVHGVEETAGRPYAVLGFVDGSTLNERLDRGPLAIPEALRSCGSPPPLPTRSRTRTIRACSIATSSRATSCWRTMDAF